MRADEVEIAIKMLPQHGPKRLAEIFNWKPDSLRGALAKHKDYRKQYALVVDIVCEMSATKSNVEIADELGWAPSSIGNMLAKRGMTRRRLAVENPIKHRIARATVKTPPRVSGWFPIVGDDPEYMSVLFGGLN